jgi:hypothetical protein
VHLAAGTCSPLNIPRLDRAGETFCKLRVRFFYQLRIISRSYGLFLLV